MAANKEGEDPAASRLGLIQALAIQEGVSVSSNLVIIKTSFSPEGLNDPLEIDSDPSFKEKDYRELGEALLSSVTWNHGEGKAEFLGVGIGLQPTDACLFLSVTSGKLEVDHLQQLVVSAFEQGAVVMDADSTEIIPPSMDIL